MQFIDATRGRNTLAEPSVNESLKQVEATTMTVLEQLVAMAERLPPASPLRLALQEQARELMNVFASQECVRFSLLNRELAHRL